MKKFKVMLEKVTFHVIEVEAENEDFAIENAENLFKEVPEAFEVIEELVEAIEWDEIKI